MLAGFLILALSIPAIAAAAARESPAVLTAAAGTAGLLWALLAVSERISLAKRRAARSRIGATTARHMGLVWLWGALGLFITYYFVLVWPEWWHFCLAFAAVGVLCLGYAAILERDADAGREDETMLTLGRYLAIGQLAGMVVTIVGLAIDPDKEFFWIREGDWAGNIIFLFGSLALAIITGHALVDDKQQR